MSSVSLTSWNSRSSFESEQKIEPALQVLKMQDADIVIIPEFASSETAPDPFVVGELNSLGYSIKSVERESENTDDRDGRILAVLSRVAVAASVVRLNHRNGLQISPLGSGLIIIGAHFDDRSEASRLEMTSGFLNKYGKKINSEPTILAGDLNCVHHSQSRKAAVIGNVARALIHPRFVSLGSRLSEMADGRTMKLLESQGYTDADPNHKPTMTFKGIPLLQLDRFMPSNDSSTNFRLGEVHVGDRGPSDHMPIRVNIEL